MNFYNRFIGAIQRKTSHLSPAAMGCYDRLIDWYYSQERPIPLDAEEQWRICGAMKAEDQAAVARVLAEFFTRTDTGWVQERAEEEIPKAQARIKAAQENGKKGGRPPGKGKAKAAPKKPSETQPDPAGLPGGQPEAKAPHSTHHSASSKEEAPLTPNGVRVQKGSAQPSEGFMRFWTAFPNSPRRVARLQCWQKWRAKGLEPLADKIVAHVESMKASKAWTKDGGEYVPLPMTYLNQQRWEAPTEAQAVAAAGESNWRDTRAGIEAMGVKLGLGKWDQKHWEASISAAEQQMRSFDEYRKRVERRFEQKQGEPA